MPETMPMPRWLTILAVACSLACCSLPLASAATEVSAATKNKNKKRSSSRPPNVIFILAEDMGLGDLACYGHPYARTPNLDRLAAEGMRFTRFYTAGATCNPSRTGFMSSRNPATLPNYNQDFGFPESHATITRLLHDAGYKTGHVGKWHIGPMDNSTLQSLGMDEVKVMGGAVNDPHGKDARVYQAGMDFIERHKDEPFYLNLWSHVAHSPVEPRETLLQEFDDLKVKRSDFDRYMQKKFDDAVEIGGDDAIDFGMKRYLADLWGMDKLVGQLLDKLDELGLRDNTILAFTADHGAAPIDTDKQSSPTSMMGWAGGLRGAKHDLFEGGLRVPFIVSWPGHIPKDRVNDGSIISALDWLPTICKLAGVPIDSNRFDGEDISTVWLGEQNAARKGPLFWKFNREMSDRAMIYGNWKLFASRGGDFSLYELDQDSAETEDRTDDEPEIAEEMKQTLLTWESMLPSQYCNLKNGCKKPIPFDGSIKPTHVGPPKVLLSDDVESIKPPIGTVDEVSKEDPKGSIELDGSVIYDGEELPSDEEEEPSVPTKKPTLANGGKPTISTNSVPTQSPTLPLRAPSVSSNAGNNKPSPNTNANSPTKRPTPSSQLDKDKTDVPVVDTDDETKPSSNVPVVESENETNPGSNISVEETNDEADASSSAKKITHCSILGVLMYTCSIVLPFWV